MSMFGKPLRNRDPLIRKSRRGINKNSAGETECCCYCAKLQNSRVVASQCRSTGVAPPRIFKPPKASSPYLLLLEKVALQGRMWRGPAEYYDTCE